MEYVSLLIGWVICGDCVRVHLWVGDGVGNVSSLIRWVICVSEFPCGGG